MCFNIVLNAQLIAHLKQILRRASDNAVHIGFLFIGEILKYRQVSSKSKGENFHLRRPSTVKGRFVGENMVFHIGHGRAAENRHQLGSIFILVDQ